MKHGATEKCWKLVGLILLMKYMREKKKKYGFETGLKNQIFWKLQQKVQWKITREE